MEQASTDRLNRLWWVAMALAASLLAGVYIKFHDYFDPKADILLPLDPACDLRKGACNTELPNGGSLSFSIQPADIPLLKPLSLEVGIAGMDVRGVAVDFAGVDMNMGYNRVALAGNGKQFKGDATLPVCVRSRMSWEARVILDTRLGTIVAPFRFETFK